MGVVGAGAAALQAPLWEELADLHTRASKTKQVSSILPEFDHCDPCSGYPHTCAGWDVDTPREGLAMLSVSGCAVFIGPPLLCFQISSSRFTLLCIQPWLVRPLLLACFGRTVSKAESPPSSSLYSSGTDNKQIQLFQITLNRETPFKENLTESKRNLV